MENNLDVNLISKENKKCEDCKYYGIFSCECPYPCVCDTKKFFELADNIEGKEEE